MEGYFKNRGGIFGLFKKIVEKEEGEELAEIQIKQLLEYKEILLDVIEEIDEAIGYISDNESEESEKEKEEEPN